VVVGSWTIMMDLLLTLSATDRGLLSTSVVGALDMLKRSRGRMLLMVGQSAIVDNWPHDSQTTDKIFVQFQRINTTYGTNPGTRCKVLSRILKGIESKFCRDTSPESLSSGHLLNECDPLTQFCQDVDLRLSVQRTKTDRMTVIE
jgi:hypothetical protein